MRFDLKTAIGAFVIVSGLVGTLVSVLVAPDSMRIASSIILLLVAVILVIWVAVPIILRWRRDKLAAIEIEELDEITARYNISQAIDQDIEWIAKLEARVYSGHDAIPREILKEWYSTNPSGFFVIRINGGRRIGHLDVLPIRPKTLNLFIEGKITERDIRGDSLYSPEEKALIKTLYVESVVISHPEGRSPASAVIYLLSNFTKIVRNIGELENIESVYAIAASKAGETLLRKLGFNLIKSSKDRKNGHDLFATNFLNLAQNISEICDDRLKERPLINELLKQKAINGL